jgi:L-2-hydroxycarboxylate dehydrogenase (NAD+)
MARKLSLDDAKAVAIDFLQRHKMPAEHATMVADHLIYATLAGHDFAGFSRLLPLSERLKQRGVGGTVTVIHETEKSATIDGADVNGYVTSVFGMDKAIELAKKSGVGIVGVHNSWFSGMLRYYVERAAQAGLIGIHASNSTARVAPHGGIDRLLGTNPMAFAFPATGSPLVIDFASASIMWGDVIYHDQLGAPLPAGRAVDSDGHPTVNPLAALAGAILPWGGARGSSVSVLVQALGILGGSDPIVGESGKWGYFFMAIDPELLMPLAQFKQRIGAMRDAIEGSRPRPGGSPVRTPGSSSRRNLDNGFARGWIEVDDAIYEALVRKF